MRCFHMLLKNRKVTSLAQSIFFSKHPTKELAWPTTGSSYVPAKSYMHDIKFKVFLCELSEKYVHSTCVT